MLRDLPNNIKMMTFLIVLIILAAVGYGIYTIIDRNGKLAVTINAVPGDARITLNETALNSEKAYLKPGSYNVKASKDGFSDFSSTQYIDEQHTAITILLTPASDVAKKWADDNQSQYLELEGKAGQAANQEGEAFRNKNPITTVLPYSNLLYTIGYRADPTDSSGNSIIIEVDAAQGYRNAAIDQIREFGYDPTDYKINLREYENPFSS